MLLYEGQSLFHNNSQYSFKLRYNKSHFCIYETTGR
jgi:hypothetical protein